MNDCFNCGGKLELIEETDRRNYEHFDFDDDFNHKIEIYKCPKCGATTIVRYPCKIEMDEWKEDGMEFSDSEDCDHHFIWQSDFMKSEMTGEELDEDDDCVVNTLYCPECGTNAEVYHLSPNEERKMDE